MADTISNALRHMLGLQNRYVDNGDGTFTELGVGTSTAGPPVGGQTGVAFVNSLSIAGAPTDTPTNMIGGASAYVVPLGRKCYLTDIWVSANSATQFEVQVKFAARIVYRGWCKGDTGPIQICGMETQNPGNGGEALSIVFSAAAATTADYYVAGYEASR